VNRRELLALIGGAAALAPFGATAQPGLPVIGYLSSRSAEAETPLRTGFLDGLEQRGFVVGRNVAIEYRFAEGHLDRLPALATDLIGLPAALALSRATKGRSKAVLFMLIILPFWTNGLVRIFSWTMVLRDGGILDYLIHLATPSAPPLSLLYSFPAIVVGLVHAYLPYMILTCYLALAAMDDAIIEAARSLGGRSPVIFWKIILPISLPGLVSGAVLIFVPVIGSFMEPRILGGRVGVTMGTVIEDQFAKAFNWPLGAALSFMMLIVVLLIFALSSRLVGDTAGSAPAVTVRP